MRCGMVLRQTKVPWALTTLLATLLACCGCARAQPASQEVRDATLAALLEQKKAFGNWDAWAAANNVSGWTADEPDYCQWGGPITSCTDGKLLTLDLTCDTCLLCEAAGLTNVNHCAGPQLQGGLSPALANIATLQKLLVKGLNISGPLPAEWGAPGAFPGLQDLALDNNTLSGSLPASWGSEGAFPQLWRLWLDDNQLTGTLPAEWGRPGAFPSLSFLQLHRNSLSGSIPAAWGEPGALPKVQACPFKPQLKGLRECVITLAFNDALCGPVPQSLQAQVCGANSTGPAATVLDNLADCVDGGLPGTCSAASPPAAGTPPAEAAAPAATSAAATAAAPALLAALLALLWSA